MGPSGTGKTSALVTYLAAGIETFVICTEPGGAESLLDWCKHERLDVNKLHWSTCLPAVSGWSGLEAMTEEISGKNFQQIADNKNGIGKDKTRPAAMRILKQFQNFECERTGQSFGDITTWEDDRALCLDSLSGLSDMAWALTVGHKPTAAQGEWNIAQNWIADLLRKIVSDRRCFFTMTSHVEKEMNELTGVNQIMVSTLGRKLAPRIPKYFSEVVYAERTPKFKWSTSDTRVDLKNRALTFSGDLPPSFVPIVNAYRERKKALSTQPQSSALPAAATS